MEPDEVRRARKALGLTQAQLAAVMGYGGRVRVAEIEGGRRALGPAAERLLRAYLAGYRPPDWPAAGVRNADIGKPPEQRAGVVALPAPEANVQAVVAAMRRGARQPRDIARITGLGLMSIAEAVAEIDRRRAEAAAKPPAAIPAKARRRGR